MSIFKLIFNGLNMDVIYILPEDITCSASTKRLIESKVKAFAALSEDLPVYIIHELSSGHNSVVYMSPKGLESLGISLEAVRRMGAEYHALFFNPEDAVNYLADWNSFIADYSNKGVWFTFFQQVKLLDSEKPVWFLSASTVIAYEEEQPLFCITLALRIHQYMPIVSKLERLIGENTFLKENLDLYTTLTKRERELLRLMALGMTPKEISGQLITSEETVRTHRRNIKRKLQIKKEVDLVYFAQAFNLV